MDDIGWWVEGKNDKEVTGKLLEAAAVATDWAGKNGVVFDYRKTEAAMFWRKKWKGAKVKAKVKVGNTEVPFHKEVTWWLRVWLDSQLTQKEHHTGRMKSERNAMIWLKWLTGQMDLSPANCRRVMMACIQSVAMFGAELWWKRDNVQGTLGCTKELQLLINQQTQATMKAFQTTNLEALSIESKLRPATNELENR